MRKMKLCISHCPRALVLFLVAGLIASTAALCAAPPGPGPLPPTCKPHGGSSGDWAAAWWQWYLSIPSYINPANDTTGSYAAQGQSGKVWFLAGQDGFSDPVVRDITVPVGTFLVVPLITAEASTAEGNGTTRDELTDTAQWYMQWVTDLTVSVDGRPVKNLERSLTTSPLFEWGPLPEFPIPLYGPDGLLPAGTKSKSVASGYFVNLAPLCAGMHTVKFASRLVIPADVLGMDEDFVMTMDVTYNIKVVHPAVPNPGVTPWNPQYLDLAAQWLQWALSEPIETNPVYDQTGEFAFKGQPADGRVFFLAGLMTMGTETSVVRHITLPAKTSLFFPVINWFDIEWGAGPPPDMLIDLDAAYVAGVYQGAAAAMVSGAPGMYASIDGRPVKDLTRYRTITRLFNMALPELNLVGSWGFPGVWGTLGPNMTDGYYLLLPPLPPGRHLIKFGQTDWPMDVTYNIRIAPPNVKPGPPGWKK